MHTHQGWSTDGTCNGSGCGVNWGKHPQTSGGRSSASLFGRNGIISTARPFRVEAAFGSDGSLSTTLSQEVALNCRAIRRNSAQFGAIL